MSEGKRILLVVTGDLEEAADLETVALPVVASASPTHLAELRRRSRSFDLFAQRVGAVKALLRGELPTPPPS